MKNKNIVSGAVLLAKQSGRTSFSSLWDIKHSLDTEKVGHTGTLDSFADGLLVVLSGNLTHLVPHITGFSKKYQAVVCFGKETDTLDPGGIVLRKGKSVTKEEIISILPKFTGALLQTPPVYSAVHVDGKRASDVIRKGEEIHLEPREIFVYKNELIDFLDNTQNDGCSYALLEIECSKGTYIRSIARDMADALESAGHLSALRRTSVGPFRLEDAAGYSMLKDFTIQAALESEKIFAQKENERRSEEASEDRKNKKKQKKIQKEYTQQDLQLFDEIKNKFLQMTPEFAGKCGFESLKLSGEWQKNYLNGRPLQYRMFEKIETPVTDCRKKVYDYAVFYEDLSFAGIITREEKKYHYGFVVPPVKQKKVQVYSWNDILENKFSPEFFSRGTALTIGSFDGFHAGHQKLAAAVLEKKPLASGIVTFSSGLKSVREDLRQVSSLQQKLDFCTMKQINFAIVIDFSDDFAKMEGQDFLDVLVNKCNMKYLAEGEDFCCGYKGMFNVQRIREYSNEAGFELQIVSDEFLSDEKISSSRVRKYLTEGNFLLVQKMLLRPFAFDCRKSEWNRENQVKEESWYCTENNSECILPPDGSYTVQAVTGKGTADESLYRTQCMIENGFIRVLLSERAFEKGISEIIF